MPTPHNPIRIAMIGVGSMGQRAHLRNYAAAADRCRVVAIAEPMAEKAKRVAARYGVSNVYADADAMLSHEELDALVVIQNFVFHGSVLPRVLDAGLPTLIEKPLAGNPQVAEQLLRRATASGTPLYVAYHKRSDPATQYAVDQTKRWRASGEVGAMRYVRLTMPPGDWQSGGFAGLITTDETPPPTSADPLPEGWSEDRNRQYVEFVNFYIHQVNLMRHLLGEDYAVENVDRSGLLLQARSESNVTALLEMAPYTTSLDWQETALVCFEKATLRLELPAPLASGRAGRVVIGEEPQHGEPQHREPKLPPIHAMQQQALNFMDAVEGKPSPLCTADEALKDLHIADDYLARLYAARS